MTFRLTLGIDEAGRGPGIGPMVLAAVAVDDGAKDALHRAGIRDSKEFGSSLGGQKARARLAEIVRKRAVWTSFEICEVEEVDAYVARAALNQLERERAAQLIRRAPVCHRIIADGRALFAPMVTEFPNFEAIDRAEAEHIAVAAASICAKALRDRLFGAIAERYAPDFGLLRGGGYVNRATLVFVSEYVRRHGHLPPEARKSWPWRGVPGLGDDNCAATTLTLPRVR